MKTLFVISKVTETSAPYNEHCLPAAADGKIGIVAYHRSEVAPPPGIAYYTGGGRIMGFLRAMHAALAEHEVDVVHAHAPVVGLLAMLAVKCDDRRGILSVFTAHNSFQNFSIRNRLLLLPIFGAYQRVVCCGEMSAQSFPSVYRGLAGDRLCAIPNGVNLMRLDRVCPVRSRRHSDKRFTVVSVGRLIDIKNPLTVLAAFDLSHMIDWGLSFVGEGYLRDRLFVEREARGLGERVQLVGSVPREEVYRRLSEADLFVSASRGEGLPVAALEAMACRCPVVLSDIEPHREIAEGASFIPLVPCGDVDAFAWQIKQFARMSASGRREIGQACRLLVERRFSLGTMRQRYEEIYTQARSAA